MPITPCGARWSLLQKQRQPRERHRVATSEFCCRAASATHYPDGRRSQAKVWFEWLHVTCPDGRPHHVEIHANHVLDSSEQRSPPYHPFQANAVGAGFRFDINFMKHVAVNVHAAVQFKGICFDSGERPELRVQVPNGGLNIHNEPVYWSLYDGRVENWTLLEPIAKRQDELLEPNSHEAYRQIAKEFGLVVEEARFLAGLSLRA